MGLRREEGSSSSSSSSMRTVVVVGNQGGGGSQLAGDETETGTEAETGIGTAEPRGVTAGGLQAAPVMMQRRQQQRPDSLCLLSTQWIWPWAAPTAAAGGAAVGAVAVRSCDREVVQTIP
jgi:hypothetical protein